MEVKLPSFEFVLPTRCGCDVLLSVLTPSVYGTPTTTYKGRHNVVIDPDLGVGIRFYGNNVGETCKKPGYCAPTSSPITLLLIIADQLQFMDIKIDPA